MSLVSYKILAGILIFLTSLVAIYYPIKVRAEAAHNWPLELGDAFASGIFLGTALFHMLPSASTCFSQYVPMLHYPIAELLCAYGFLLLLFLEKLANKSTAFYILAAIMIIHCVIEGSVLGINNTLSTTSIIFLAIIAHKGSESFAFAIMLNRSKLAYRIINFLAILFALATPLGIMVGASIMHALQSTHGLIVTAGFNAFAAGTFLYMSTLHHINHHRDAHQHEGIYEFFALSLGLSIMAFLACWS